ncbi:MAG TPA: ATP-binding protein [Solirubrobacteraceae bacterium]|nr:ATP-binding protein [Solirubrobacteraceae bacterium]
MDVQHALQARLDEVGDPETDPEARRLMAQVALAKATSFIALLRADGRLLDVTDAPLTSAGLDRHEVIGHVLWQTPWCRHSEDVQADLRRAVELAADGRLARFDVELMMGSGGTVSETVDLVLRPLRGADGRVAFIVAEGRQVSDRKRAEERIARQNAELSVLTDRLARIHHFRERLLAELSHDLRAPLQIVLTRAERLRRNRRGRALDAETQGIRLAALDALEQVDAMLEQVRRDHGEARLSLVDDDLGAIVRSVAEQFDALAHERQITLLVDVPDALQSRFDPERISRVISNLLANALRFAPPGGVARVSLRQAGESALLEVADSGVGVPPEQRPVLFERFRTADNGKGRAGTGLGLAIVKEFVQLHGGTVEVGEAPEGGALFSVLLPREPAASELAPIRLSQQLAAARRTRYVKEHLAAELAGTAPPPLEELGLPSVLLVDSDPDRSGALTGALQGRAGVFSASEATEALRLATDLQPDMVVIGELEGDITATALLDRMAREWRLAGVLRVALVQRGGDPAVRTALLESGAQDFIAEPAGPDEMRARFHLLLEHAALRRRAEAAEAELRRLRGPVTPQ